MPPSAGPEFEAQHRKELSYLSDHESERAPSLSTITPRGRRHNQSPPRHPRQTSDRQEFVYRTSRPRPSTQDRETPGVPLVYRTSQPRPASGHNPFMRQATSNTTSHQQPTSSRTQSQSQDQAHNPPRGRQQSASQARDARGHPSPPIVYRTCVPRSISDQPQSASSRTQSQYHDRHPVPPPVPDTSRGRQYSPSPVRYVRRSPSPQISCRTCEPKHKPNRTPFLPRSAHNTADRKQSSRSTRPRYYNNDYVPPEAPDPPQGGRQHGQSQPRKLHVRILTH